MEGTTMIGRALTSFISVVGLGATILTLVLLSTPYNPGDVAIGGQIDGSDILGGRIEGPYCGDAYRGECGTFYHLNQWHNDTVRYGTATITIKHKVAYDYHRQQYRYDYIVDYNGNKNVLMRWDVLDRMRSEDPDSSCILELERCHPHTFTMWCDEAPIMKKGLVQLYNNRPHTNDWNYWQCNEDCECDGPVPSSYPDRWWPKERIRLGGYEILRS